MFPDRLTITVEHLFDRTHKRVAAVKLVRFQDLVIHHEHQREVDPAASGHCLAEANRKGWFELPLFNHDVKQFVARADGRRLKLLYVDQARNEAGEPNPPEVQVKLHECFALKEHPRICEGRMPIKLGLCAPDGKRLEATCDWPAFKTSGYPKLKA